MLGRRGDLRSVPGSEPPAQERGTGFRYGDNEMATATVLSKPKAGRPRDVRPDAAILQPNLVIQALSRIDGDDVVPDTGDLVADITVMVWWTVEMVCRPAGRAALIGLLGEPRDGLMGRRGVGDAWIAGVVSVVLDGIRPPAPIEREKGPVAR